MGGNDGIRGYQVQTIIAVLESLTDGSSWETITVEPKLESQKVDIKWTYTDASPRAVQVKSTRNTFKHWEVEKWCRQMEKDIPPEYTKELILIGSVIAKTSNKTELHGVQIPNARPLNIEAMIDEASTKLDRFYTKHNRNKLNVNLREILILALLGDFTNKSVFSVELTKDEFNNQVLGWIETIEGHIKNNVLTIFSDIDKSESKQSMSHLLSGKILELIGWNQFSENQEVRWIEKNQEEEKTVTVDYVGEFESSLKGNVDDRIIIRARDTAFYPSDPADHVREIYQESIPIVEELIESNSFSSSERDTEIYNLYFWFSLGLNDDDRYFIIESLDGEYGNKYMAKEGAYFLMDNAKSNFLISSLVTARNYREEVPVKFLYPITQANMDETKIGKRGTKLPVQFINSSVIPIIKEDRTKISFLLFCSDRYSQDALRKLIWLTIKITSGLANEYVIYFPDFENDYENEVRTVVRSFRNDDLSERVTVKRISKINGEDLVALPSLTQNNDEDIEFEEAIKKVELKPVNTLFTDYLPYGDLLTPFLKTGNIQAKDLKYFLAKRGIFFKNADKVKIIDFMSSLVFSPSELDAFRKMIDIKEKGSKTDTAVNQIKEGIGLDDILKTLPKINPTQLTDKLAAKIVGQPAYKKVDDRIEIEFHTEVKDPTSHLSVNLTVGRVNISLKIVDGKLLTTAIRTTSKDDKLIANRIVKANQEALEEKGITVDDAKKLHFSDFKDNRQRVQFLLSFTEISSSRLFTDQEITNVQFNYDESEDIPESLWDKTDKELTIYFNGKNLEGLREIKDDDFKKLILLEAIIIQYKFKWANVSDCLYTVKFNFSNFVKARYSTGLFQSEPRLIKNYKVKNMSNIGRLEKTLLDEVERLKLEKLQKFDLI